MVPFVRHVSHIHHVSHDAQQLCLGPSSSSVHGSSDLGLEKDSDWNLSPCFYPIRLGHSSVFGLRPGDFMLTNTLFYHWDVSPRCSGLHACAHLPGEVWNAQRGQGPAAPSMPSIWTTCHWSTHTVHLCQLVHQEKLCVFRFFWLLVKYFCLCEVKKVFNI